MTELAVNAILIVNRKHLGFPHCCQGDHKISKSQVGIGKTWHVVRETFVKTFYVIFWSYLW